MKTTNGLLNGANRFLDEIFAALKQAGIDTSLCFLDHLCYRVATQEEYAQAKLALLKQGRLLHETSIGGRPIATFRLHEPLVYLEEGRMRKIPCVELPAPKPGSPYSTGLEHAEFVILESFEAFQARYPKLLFDLDGAAKPVNAELRLRLGPHSVKFHHQALEEVIAGELARKI